MKYILIGVPAILLAIYWGWAAGFLVCCAASLIILKLWEHEQTKKKESDGGLR